MTDLYLYSVESLLQNQYASGGFPASPNFPAYQYSWFRDGSFIAYALDLAGYPEQAERFHSWCMNTIGKHAWKILQCIDQSDNTSQRSSDSHFHCRFTENGDEVAGHWGNNQLDGLGTWLWALEKHILFNPQSALMHKYAQQVDLIAIYLACMWKFPCSDCWEENESEIHVSTLAAIYAGLLAHSNLRNNEKSLAESREVKQLVNIKTKGKEYLPKSLQNSEIDASLLWTGWPYNLVDLRSSIFLGTLKQIEKDLISPEGGIHRYSTDTYYGGGEWLLLSAWYGLVKLHLGDKETAYEQLEWIGKQADQDGNLPEQVNNHLINESYYKIWTEKWGLSANPLLWSHAMYIILKKSIDNQ